MGIRDGKDKDLCYAVTKSLLKLPLAITQKTGEVSADCLALGERIGQQNVSSSLQKSS